MTVPKPASNCWPAAPWGRCRNSTASFRSASVDEQRWDAKGELITLSKATIKVEVQGQMRMAVAEGTDSFKALDMALRNVLLPIFPALQGMRLADYQVRIHAQQEGTKAVTRVMINSHDVTRPRSGAGPPSASPAMSWMHVIARSMTRRPVGCFRSASEPAGVGAIWHLHAAAVPGAMNVAR